MMLAQQEYPPHCHLQRLIYLHSPVFSTELCAEVAEQHGTPIFSEIERLHHPIPVHQLIVLDIHDSTAKLVINTYFLTIAHKQCEPIADLLIIAK